MQPLKKTAQNSKHLIRNSTPETIFTYRSAPTSTKISGAEKLSQGREKGANAETTALWAFKAVGEAYLQKGRDQDVKLKNDDDRDSPQWRR